MKRAVVALALAASLASAPRAQEAPDLDAELPLASILSKVTWARASGVTRIGFHGTRSIEPLEVVRASPGVLRIDLTAVDASAVPRALPVGTEEVLQVVRVPATLGVLPDGVSARFLVRLADGAADFVAVSEPHGFDLHVGDAEVVARRERAADTVSSAWVEAAIDRGRLEDDPPRAEDRIAPMSVRLDSQRPVRSAPNALAAVLRTLEGGTRVTLDARRDAWVHLAGGGWILQAGLPVPMASAPAQAGAPTAVAARSSEVIGVGGGERPTAWTAVTLGTGLAIELRELTSQEAEVVRPVVGLFAEPVRLAVASFAARGSGQYGFRIPPRADRFVIELEDGRRLGSLDPTELPLVTGAAEADVLAAFPTAELVSGQGWSGLVPLPLDADLSAAEGVVATVGGQEHRLFAVPGTGAGVGE